jgi:hypothetical protein
MRTYIKIYDTNTGKAEIMDVAGDMDGAFDAYWAISDAEADKPNIEVELITTNEE